MDSETQQPSQAVTASSHADPMADQDWESLLQSDDKQSDTSPFMAQQQPEEVAERVLEQPAVQAEHTADTPPKEQVVENHEQAVDTVSQIHHDNEDINNPNHSGSSHKDAQDAPGENELQHAATADGSLPDQSSKGVVLEPLKTDFEEDTQLANSEQQIRPFSIIASSATDFFAQHNDDADEMDDWARELGGDVMGSQTPERAKSGGAALEDEWAKALGDNDSGVDTTWENAFADDEGFLEDEDDFSAKFEHAMNLNHQPAPTGAEAVPRSNSVTNSIPIPAPQRQQQQQQQQQAGPMVFFEELPSTLPVRSKRPKPIPVSSNNSQTVAPPPSSSAHGLQLPPQAAAPLPPSVLGSHQYHQLQAPAKLDPFPSTALSDSVHASPSPPLQESLASKSNNARYSPAMQAPQSTLAASRYAAVPSPSLMPQPSPKVDPTQATRSVSPYAPLPASQASRPSKYAKAPSPAPPPASVSASAPPLRPAEPAEARTNAVAAESRYSLANNSSSVEFASSPSKPPPTSAYAHDFVPSSDPLSHSIPPPTNRFAPRTSSPLAHFEQSTTAEGRRVSSSQLPRAMSPPVQLQTISSPPPSADHGSPYVPGSQTGSPRRSSSSSPQLLRTEAQTKAITSMSTRMTQEFYNHPPIRAPHQSDVDNIAPPQDETAHDPLQRWKGRPIFRWNSSGLLSSSFPQHIPQYGGGHMAPMIKPLAGDVKIRRSKDILPDEGFQSFPGPLKSKGKKKELLAWLTSKVASIELELKDENQPTPQRLRTAESSILWQVVKLLVEHDGVLNGKQPAEESLRQILAAGESDANTSFATGELDPVPENASQPRSHLIREIRASLALGDRAKAVWYAVDHRDWGHAMLLSSTLEPSVWKQVVQEFVRVEIRSSREDRKSLAALYQSFGGNWGESIDELVPASARAGFQMISTVAQPGETRDALEGLNKWRETLSMILSNRSKDDENTILALGKLLAGYGRIEAAHVCYILARPLSQFGGCDGAETHFTLLGGRFVEGSVATSNNADAIILSEIYEFALSQLSVQTSQQFPHLLAYKLQHAYLLAECGQRTEALQYCDVVAATVKSTTKPSLHYHATLFAQLDDLQKRLSQSPKDPASSWIAKPSLEKVSSGMWARFNSFVAGEDGDAASSGSGYQSETESGPFAKANGGSPTISRSGSVADLYGAGATSVNGAIPINSRYAPSPYLASQDYGGHGRPTSSGSTTSFGSPPVLSHFSRQPSHLSKYQTMSRSDSKDKPTKRVPSYEPYVPVVSEESSPASSPGFGPIDAGMPGSNAGSQRKPSGLSIIDPSDSSFGPDDSTLTVPGNSLTNGYESSGYEPPASNYDPPSYEPYQASDEGDAEHVSPKKTKKSMMDDNDADDEFERRAADLKRASKAQRDREADDLVKKAAEADAARDKAAANDRKSWLGGWFAKKDPNAPVVHKAKLGEESSFYYDAETKKWVNKKAGPDASAPTSTPTPPPPKGPPMRSVSGPPTSVPRSASAGLPPPPMPTTKAAPSPAIPPSDHLLASGPPSRNGTPLSDTSGSGAGGDMPPPLSKPSLPPGLTGPPSRPTTSMSNASSIDDLIGGPAARKGGSTKKGKKGQRYVDVMAQS